MPRGKENDELRVLGINVLNIIISLLLLGVGYVYQNQYIKGRATLTYWNWLINTYKIGVFSIYLVNFVVRINIIDFCSAALSLRFLALNIEYSCERSSNTVKMLSFHAVNMAWPKSKNSQPKRNNRPEREQKK